MIKFLLPEIRVDFCHRCLVRSLSLLFKIIKIFTTLLGVEFLPLSFFSVMLDKQLIKMIGALWLAGAQRNNFFHICSILCTCVKFFTKWNLLKFTAMWVIFRVISSTCRLSRSFISTVSDINAQINICERYGVSCSVNFNFSNKLTCD